MGRRPNHIRCWSVSELNRHLKELLEGNPLLVNLWVKGEVSNLRQPGSGHLYFTLKDSLSSVRCIMFRSRAINLLFRLQEGMQVMLQGSLSLYERDGIYQLNVQEVHSLGTGDLFQAFQQLKDRLAREGLFSQERKMEIPILPGKIGIVTSLTGAALKDILLILHKRYPNQQIFIAPALVQGVEAPRSIASALAALNRHGQAEVIILGRGGGSLEELWAFNTEEVARAIAASRIPVVSAVGHETDYTIADLTADLRAPTPSAAAAMVVPELAEELLYLSRLLERSQKALITKLQSCWQRVHTLYRYSNLSRPQYLFDSHFQYLEYTEKRLFDAWNSRLKDRQNALQHMVNKLDSLSPLRILTRGFAFCQDAKGMVIAGASQVKPGELIEVRFADGELLCLVEEVRLDEKQG
ncbi:MAG TPA: exodeoxyribonuclease VII large subunit [Clostridia bacterium]|nr:exodeoxyribonuclease VII large subunit [Clostridia bacterium]